MDCGGQPRRGRRGARPDSSHGRCAADGAGTRGRARASTARPRARAGAINGTAGTADGTVATRDRRRRHRPRTLHRQPMPHRPRAPAGPSASCRNRSRRSTSRCGCSSGHSSSKTREDGAGREDGLRRDRERSEGFQIKSADDAFTLRLRGYLQSDARSTQIHVRPARRSTRSCSAAYVRCWRARSSGSSTSGSCPTSAAARPCSRTPMST